VADQDVARVSPSRPRLGLHAPPQPPLPSAAAIRRSLAAATRCIVGRDNRGGHRRRRPNAKPREAAAAAASLGLCLATPMAAAAGGEEHREGTEEEGRWRPGATRRRHSRVWFLEEGGFGFRLNLDVYFFAFDLKLVIRIALLDVSFYSVAPTSRPLAHTIAAHNPADHIEV
jgi:hypothetical protein